MVLQFDFFFDFGDFNIGDFKLINNQMTDDFDLFSFFFFFDVKGGSGMDLMGEFNFDVQVRNGNVYNLFYLVVYLVFFK